MCTAALPEPQRNVAEVLNEVLWGASILELIVCLVELVPLAMLVLALWNWTSFAKSRHYVLWAWFFAFFSPFVVSLFPMRYMLSFSAVDAQDMLILMHS